MYKTRHPGAWLIALVWCLVPGTTLTTAQPQTPPGEAGRQGHQYFVQYCSACHGGEGRGDGPAAERHESLGDVTAHPDSGSGGDDDRERRYGQFLSLRPRPLRRAGRVAE